MLKKWIEKFKSNFYVRMMASYTAITVVSVVICMAIFITYQQNSFLRQEEYRGSNLLTQFTTFSDRYLAERVYMTITKETFELGTHEFGGINGIFDSKNFEYTPGNFDQVLSMQEQLYRLHSTMDYVASMSIFDVKNQALITSMSGIYYDIFDRRYELEGIVDYGLFDRLGEQTVNQFFISPEENREFFGDKDIVTLVQTYPVFKPPEEAESIFCIYMELDKSLDGFLQNHEQGSENYKIVDTQWDVLYDSDGISESTLPEELQQLVEEEKEGSKKIELDGKTCMVHWDRSEYFGWTYVYTRALNSVFLVSIQSLGWVLLGLLLVLLFSLAVSTKISRWLYRPLDEILVRVKTMVGGWETGDLSQIEEAFTSVHRQMGQLRSVVAENNMLMLEHIFSDLINNKISSFEELNGRLAILGKAFQSRTFCLILTKMDETSYEALRYHERELVRITVTELINQYYQNCCPDQFVQATIFDYAGYLTTVVNGRTAAECEKDAEALLREISRHFPELFNIALSRPVEVFSQFHDVFTETRDYFRYAFIHGFENIFTPEKVAGYEQNQNQYNLVALQKLDQTLKSGAFDQFKEELRILIDSIKQGDHSFLYAYHFIVQLLSLISGNCIQQNVTLEGLSGQDIAERLSRSGSLDECYSWVCAVVDEYAEKLGRRREEIDHSVICKIEAYILDHVDGELSLNSVADAFGMSPGYLSRIFKERSGKNFSDFVTAAKLEKACYLLTADRNAKVSDISAELGYASVDYFTKVFKARFGMTPTQFRKNR